MKQGVATRLRCHPAINDRRFSRTTDASTSVTPCRRLIKAPDSEASQEMYRCKCLTDKCFVPSTFENSKQPCQCLALGLEATNGLENRLDATYAVRNWPTLEIGNQLAWPPRTQTLPG